MQDYDPIAVRHQFGGVRPLPFDEQLALQAGRLQDMAITDGHELSVRDAMVAATARSTGDELVVADSDFDTEVLTDYVTVTNLGD